MPKPNSDCCATERKHPWPMVRLGDVCETINGIWKGTKAPLVTVGIIRSTNMTKQCEFSLEKTVYVDVEERKYRQRKLLPGDIIVERSGGGPGQPVGRAVYFDVKDGEYSVSNFTSILRVKDDACLSAKFLQKCLTAQYFQGVTEGIQSNTTGLHNLDFEAYLNIEIPLPPLSVQREIVARLERELAAVEKIKKDFEALAETAKTEFKAELKEVFEEISRGGAETRRLGEICELISDCPHTTAKDEGVGIPLIRTPNVGFTRLILAGVHRVSEDVYKQRTKRAIPLPGDLIFAREAPAGNVAVIQSGEKVCLGQRTVLLRLRKGCFSDYIAYSMLQPESQKILIQRSTGSTVAHVNVCDIKTFPIHIPPLAVQRQIVARLDSAKARAEKLEAKAREGVAVCETMRKAILKEAFE